MGIPAADTLGEVAALPQVLAGGALLLLEP